MEIRRIDSSDLPVDLSDLMAQLRSRNGYDSLQVWKSARILVGNQQTELQSVFCVTDDKQSVVRWTGDLSNVHYLGFQLEGGHWLVEGDIGDHAGQEMKQGTLTIQGSAGHWLAAGAGKANVLVLGDVGDYAAASLPGHAKGVNGLRLLINGSAGNFLARRMRRGWVAVAGNVGEMAAYQMLAGTLVMGGQALSFVGQDMKRGTLIFCNDPTTNELVARQWRAGIPMAEPVWPLVRSELMNAGYPDTLPAASHIFRRFHGAPEFQGRPELWLV